MSPATQGRARAPAAEAAPAARRRGRPRAAASIPTPCGERFDDVVAGVAAVAAKRTWIKVKERLGREIDRDHRLRGTASRVARVYMDHVNRRPGYAWCSACYVAGELDVSVRTVERATRALLRAGVIVRREVRSKGRASRLWYTTLPGLVAVDRRLEAERDGAATSVSGDAAAAAEDPSDNSQGPVKQIHGEHASDSQINDLRAPTLGVVHPDKKETPLYPPHGGGDRRAISSSDRRRLHLLDTLREDSKALHVVETLLAPLLTKRRLSDPDPLGAMRRVRNQAADLAPDVLAAAAGDVLKARTKQFRPDHVTEAVAKRRKMGLAFVVKPGMPEWRRWCDHWAKHDPKRHSLMHRIGVSQEHTQWPPPAA